MSIVHKVFSNLKKHIQINLHNGSIYFKQINESLTDHIILDCYDMLRYVCFSDLKSVWVELSKHFRNFKQALSPDIWPSPNIHLHPKLLSY